MSDYRAAMRHLTRAQNGMSRAGIILDVLEDEPENIHALDFDPDAPKELEHAKFHIEVALEILNDEHEESNGGFPDEHRSEPVL